MTQKEKIEKLEADVEELKKKIAALEARPVFVPVTIPMPAPAPIMIPWAPSVPGTPYIGDPMRPIITCQSNQNTMSTQRSDFVQ